MRTYIDISNLKILACHGCHAEEKTEKQPFVFTVRLETDFSGARDRLEGTVSYSDVMKLLVGFCEGHCFNLIETLATEAAKLILKRFSSVRRVRVTVAKPEAPVPLDFETVSATAELGWETAFVALGSNLGDRKGYLDGAVSFLREAEGVRVLGVSSYLETEPYGGVADRRFLNAAAKIETILSPLELLDVLQKGERAAHRERKEHWGNRTLDLDLLLYGEEIVRSERLTLPHPEMTKREFVLAPLAEIDPFAFVPTERKTAGELLARLRQK